jgi:hypothetical protein
MVLEKEAGVGMIGKRTQLIPLSPVESWVRRVALLVLFLHLPLAAFADSSALILRGVAGDDEHAEKFNKWTEDTRKALVEKFAFSPDRVMVLADRMTAQAEVKKAFATLKTQLRPLDTLFIFFIGHGSGEGDYKFNISGPDLTATDYNTLLSSLTVGRIVIVNGTNSSGGAIETLAGKNRVIVTATRSGQEGNDTVFYEYFVEGLQKAEADEDKDQKISVWEAFKYATAGVDRFYKEEGRLVTEHAQISDNGAAKIAANAKEIPQLARSLVFQVDRPVVTSDPRLAALINERREIEQKIEALRLGKSGIPEPEYEKQMEELLVQLALKNQQIRAQEPKK